MMIVSEGDGGIIQTVTMLVTYEDRDETPMTSEGNEEQVRGEESRAEESRATAMLDLLEVMKELPKYR